MEILKNNKSNRFNKHKNKIGLILGIQDCNNEPLLVGDKVKYNDYVGRILYNPYSKLYELMLDYSMWYGTDEFNPKSYGKSISIPMDNGAKPQLLLLGR